MHPYKILTILLVISITLIIRKWQSRDENYIPALNLRRFAILLIVPILSWRAGYPSIDDSYIYARYIANALSGKGMVFNTGERVNALTSPFFSYLTLGTAYLLHGNVLLATTLLSALFLLLAALVAESMVPFAGLLIASTAYFYGLVGMESSLFLFMLLMLVYIYKSRQTFWLPLAAILLILTRFEGALLVALVAIQVVREKTRIRLVSLIPPALVTAAYLFLNHIYYGAWLPSSAVAKVSQGFSGYWGEWPTAFLGHTELVLRYFSWTVYIIPILASLCILSFLKPSHQLFSRVILPFWVGLVLFYVGINASGYYIWYFAPIIMFGIFYAAHGIPATRTASIGAAVLIVALTITNARFLSAPDPVSRYSGYVQAGQWLKQNTDPKARVAAVETGFLGWTCGRYLDDVIGLTTPKNAVYIAHHDGSSWLAEDRPDYIVVHDADWPWEEVAKTSKDYAAEPMHFPGGVYILKRQPASIPTPTQGRTRPTKTKGGTAGNG